MSKHYIYRMDHDVNFAPNIDYGICTLCGCKKNTIEKWATSGSWIIGIGGNGTRKPNKLIYAMEVEKSFSFSAFCRRYPGKSKYLKGIVSPNAPVLVSRRFLYFGENAINLPQGLHHIIYRGRGCKRVSEQDIAQLRKYFADSKCNFGVHGVPCNGDYRGKQKICQTKSQYTKGKMICSSLKPKEKQRKPKSC